MHCAFVIDNVTPAIAYTNATKAIFRRNRKGAPLDRFYPRKIYLGRAAFEYSRREAIMLGRVACHWPKWWMRVKSIATINRISHHLVKSRSYLSIELFSKLIIQVMRRLWFFSQREAWLSCQIAWQFHIIPSDTNFLWFSLSLVA